MAEDESTPTPPTEDELDLGVDDEALETLPKLVRNTLKSAAAIPGTARQLAIWVPTVAAAWRAGERAVALSRAMRDQLETEQPVQWPQELADEFMATLREFGDTLPSIDEAIPIASDLVEIGEEHISSEMAQTVLSEGLSRLENVTEKLVGRLLELAFFDPEPTEGNQKTEELLSFFMRLEDLFDRALEAWLIQQQPAEPDS